MKIVAINASPNGRDGNTNIMVNSFLKGAQEAGAETVNIFLAEKDIKHCKGCFSCWFNTPGKCVIEDDMAETLSLAEGSSIVVWATPIRYANITGMLKVFIERMLVLCNPYFEIAQNGQTRHPKKPEAEESSFYRSNIVLLACGGLGTRDHIKAASQWIKKLAFYNHSEVIGEIYAPQGLLLSYPAEELKRVTNKYLQLLERAGREVVANKGLSEDTKDLLEQDFMPVENYVQLVNQHFGSLLSKIKHPYMKG